MFLFLASSKMQVNLSSFHFTNFLKNIGRRPFHVQTARLCDFPLMGRFLRFAQVAKMTISRNALFPNSVNMQLGTNVQVACQGIYTRPVGFKATLQPPRDNHIHLEHHTGSICPLEPLGFRNTVENRCLSSVHKSAALPSIDSCHPTRHGSTSGMSGSKTLTHSDVFSDKNRERIMTHLSSKRKLHRFYTKDIKKRGGSFGTTLQCQ